MCKLGSEGRRGKVGLRRGFVMFLQLFTIFMNGVMKEIREKLGINGSSLWDARYKQEWKVDCLMFANDTALVADSVERLQELALGYVCKRRKLKVDPSKSKVMRIGGHSEENTRNASLNGRGLEEAERNRYLGVDILNDRKMSKEVNNKVDSALMSLWKRRHPVLS